MDRDDDSLADDCVVAEQEKKSPARLCDIYLRDVISLITHSEVQACRGASHHCNSTISRVGTSQLPRRVFDNFYMLMADVCPAYACGPTYPVQTCVPVQENQRTSFQPYHHFYLSNRDEDAWTPHQELPCLANCACDRELLHSAAQSLVGTLVFPHGGAEDIVAVSVWHCREKPIKEEIVFDFRAVNRLADVETALHLLHLLWHLSDVVIRHMQVERYGAPRPKGVPIPCPNPALIQQVTNLHSGSTRKAAVRPFRLHVSPLDIALDGVGDIDLELTTRRQFIHAHRLYVYDLSDPLHAQQVLALIAGQGQCPPGEIREMLVEVDKSLYSSFIDTMVEVGARTHSGPLRSHSPAELFRSFSTCPPSSPTSTHACRK